MENKLNCPDEIELLKLIIESKSESPDRQTVLDHVKSCTNCATILGKKMNLWAKFQQVSAERRKCCPNAWELYKFSVKQLPKEKQREIKHHIKSCTICQVSLREAKEIEEEITATELSKHLSDRLATLKRLFETVKTVVIEFLRQKSPAEVQYSEAFLDRIESILPSLTLDSSKWPFFKKGASLATSLGIVSASEKSKESIIYPLTISSLALSSYIITREYPPSEQELASVLDDYCKRLEIQDELKAEIISFVPQRIAANLRSNI